MLINTDKLQSAKHILLVTHNDAFMYASALYSYILTLHKKVSLQNIERIDSKFSFLAWFDKCRQNKPSTADYIIEVESSTLALYTFFLENDIKINQKIATALYAGLLIEYDAFISKDCDGTIFAIASTLVGLGAQQQMCHDFLLFRVPLSYMRLKERLLKTLVLTEDATHANVSICDDDLNSSNAGLLDAYAIMKEFLKIVHVEKVTLLKSDENNKIIKEI